MLADSPKNCEVVLDCTPPPLCYQDLRLHPVLEALNIDLRWFGVLVVLAGVGVNVYIIKGIAPDIPLEKIFRGIVPFLIALTICTIILMFVPEIATFLTGLSSQ